MFTDIEGSTALLGRLGEGLYAQLLAAHHALIRSGLAAHGGREVDTQGDAFFAVFSSPRACAAAAIDLQRALAAKAWPGGERVLVRMGMHTGEAAKTATGLVGLDVHRAARVAAVGYGGQVLVSEAVVDIATARRLGEQAVALARQLGTEKLLIESLTVLGHVYCFAGELERGLPPVQEAVQRARQLGDDVLLGESLTMRMTFLTSPADAEPLFNEAIACTQRSGDQLYAYYLNSYAGGQALYAGDIRAARAHLGQAAQFIRAIRDEDLNLLYLTGWVLRQDNDRDGARSSFLAILRIDRRIGNRAGIAAASLALACLAADAGDWHQAAMLHGAAQAILPTGIQWDELEDRNRRDSLDQIRCQLGQEGFERAYAAGSALGFDQALDLACGQAIVSGGAHHGPFGIRTS